MSRSYKKFPCAGNCSKWAKNQANRIVRRNKEDIPNGKHYTKIYPSWDIWEGSCWIDYEYTRQQYESELKAYLHGGLRYDPRDYFERHSSYTAWYKSYKMK